MLFSTKTTTHVENATENFHEEHERRPNRDPLRTDWGVSAALLTLPQTDDSEPLGKYGRMRLVYLKNQRPVLYNQMLLNGTLWPHLQDVQKTACEWLERTMTTLLDKYPAPDKERAQLLWVAHMNGLKAQAEEVVVREVVYTE